MSDLTGNVSEWTSSLYGVNDAEPDYVYPYRAEDGREDAEAGTDVLRVARGGTWLSGHTLACAALRSHNEPGLRGSLNGIRLALPPI